MQARAVVVAVEIRVLERKVREGVRAVDDHFDAALAAHLADSLDREYLPGEIGDVANVNDAGARRDRALEPLIQIIHDGGGTGKRDGVELDALAAFALPPGSEHARIVLIGGEHFVAGLEVEPEDADLERLRWRCA